MQIKTTIILGFTLLALSCKEKNNVTPNTAPASFTVTPTLQSDGKTIDLSWTAAVDAEGDEVSYAVFLAGDTLVKGLKKNTYALPKLDYNQQKEGKVIASDAKGLKTEVAFTAKTMTMEYTLVPDPKFEQFLINANIDIDGINGKFETHRAKNITKLEVHFSFGVTNLKGIEAFTNLEVLDCYRNLLTELDLSQNLNLKTLVCTLGKLKKLNVTNCSKLQSLSCFENELTELDLSTNKSLTSVNAFNNKLVSLDVSQCASLTSLSATNNNLKSLNTLGSPLLTYLEVSLNKLEVLDLRNNINITRLIIGGNKLKTMDVRHIPKLEWLYISSNELNSLNIGNASFLEEFGCADNQLTKICITSSTVVKPNWKKDSAAVYEVCP